MIIGGLRKKLDRCHGLMRCRSDSLMGSVCRDLSYIRIYDLRLSSQWIC